MKFINRIDHVTWIFHQKNIDANVEYLARLFDVTFEPPRVSEEMGFVMYFCWEAGLEVVCPLADITPFNQTLHDYLALRGEGLMSVVFGVKDLQKTRERLARQGFEPGAVWENHPDSPWKDKVTIRECDMGVHLNTYTVFSQIDYADGVVTIEH